MFIAIGEGALLLTLFGAVQGLVVDQQRFIFPACADSIAIPIAELIIIAPVIGLTCLIFGLILVSRFGRLPVYLLHWDASRPVRSWLVSVPAGLVGLLGLISMFMQLPTTGAFVIPGELICLYLVASTRAGLLAPPITR